MFKNQWVIYMLRVRDGSLYTGITNNLNLRLDAHVDGKGSKYVRANLPFKVVYLELTSDRSKATQRELFIKDLSKKEKESLISGSGIRCPKCQVILVNAKLPDIRCYCTNLIKEK